MRRRRVRGATTVEWLILAMVMGVVGIAMWQQFRGRVADTVARGGDCVLALDGACAGGSAAAAAVAAAPPMRGGSSAGSTPAGTTPAGATSVAGVIPVAGGLPVGAPVGSSSLQWGPPGFSQGWTPQQREQYLAQHGVADPDVNYWTPFWNGDSPNQYTGNADTGPRNTFGTIHDYNLAHDDWGWLGDYFDVVTPLTGRTHTDIDNSAARLGRALKNAIGIK